MVLHGELEHFPLSDVIQLLHLNAKSGILYLRSSSGECKLVFHKGFFVSASHLDGRVRIGDVLVEMAALSPEKLKMALLIQEMAGKLRKPLIATMIEEGMIDKEAAFKGLERLIEMTIVEVLTWKGGSFSFDITSKYVADEYKFFPEKLHVGILLNAQSVLMDSLRIYDEKMRDGTLSDLLLTRTKGDGGEPDFGTALNTACCLEALDTLSRKVQELFTGFNDCPHDEKECAGSKSSMTPIDHQGDLVSYLTTISGETQRTSI